VCCSYCLSSPVQTTGENHRLANRQTLVLGHTFGELSAHKRLVRKAGKREGRKPDSLLEEKGRAVKEPKDGPRQACYPLPKPPQQTHGLRVLFLTNPPTLLILVSRTSLSVTPTTGLAWGRARDQGKL